MKTHNRVGLALLFWSFFFLIMGLLSRDQLAFWGYLMAGCLVAGTLFLIVDGK